MTPTSILRAASLFCMPMVLAPAVVAADLPWDGVDLIRADAVTYDYHMECDSAYLGPDAPDSGNLVLDYIGTNRDFSAMEFFDSDDGMAHCNRFGTTRSGYHYTVDLDGLAGVEQMITDYIIRTFTVANCVNVEVDSSTVLLGNVEATFTIRTWARGDLDFMTVTESSGGTASFQTTLTGPNNFYRLLTPSNDDTVESDIEFWPGEYRLTMTGTAASHGQASSAYTRLQPHLKVMHLSPIDPPPPAAGGPDLARADLDSDGRITAEDLCHWYASPVDIIIDGTIDDQDRFAMLGLVSETFPDVNGDDMPDTCQCFGDINDDGAVDAEDLILLLAGWGPCPEPCDAGGCPGDCTGDCIIDTDDFVSLLWRWGSCP